MSYEERLLAGELDAAFLVKRPSSFDAPAPMIAPLFTNAKSAEQRWFSQTGIFPIMHTVAVRKVLLDSDPILGRHIFDAFEKAKQAAISELEVMQAPKVTLPWPHSAVAETRALMGRDFWPYGIRANRHTLQTQIAWSYLDGL